MNERVSEKMYSARSSRPLIWINPYVRERKERPREVGRVRRVAILVVAFGRVAHVAACGDYATP